MSKRPDEYWYARHMGRPAIVLVKFKEDTPDHVYFAGNEMPYDLVGDEDFAEGEFELIAVVPPAPAFLVAESIKEAVELGDGSSIEIIRGSNDRK